MIRFGVWKLIVLLVLSVALLQIIHMFLLSRLDSLRSSPTSLSFIFPLSVPSSSSFSSELTLNGKDGMQKISSDSLLLSVDFHNMINAYEQSSILDSSGEYKIVNSFASSDTNEEEDDVTLVTQCSVHHLFHLITLAARWNGPISLALFVTKQSEIPTTIVTVARLRRCHETIRNNTKFHLVYPLTATDITEQIVLIERLLSDENDSNKDCGESTFVSTTLGANYELGGVPYPNNLLRNVARRNAFTKFVFVVDADMVPNENLRCDFVSFARSNRLFDSNPEGKDDKTVYVVPSFEMYEEDEVPRDKRTLIRMFDGLFVRPFYFELCQKCQKYTNYDAWQRVPFSSTLGVVFEVLWKDPWEPFYLSRNDVPFYDERFKQYGFNRISQVCELHVAGYKFSVLNNAFVVHKGLKKLDSFHRRKDEDQESNRLLFRLFKTQLKEKYPDSQTRCY